MPPETSDNTVAFALGIDGSQQTTASLHNIGQVRIVARRLQEANAHFAKLFVAACEPYDLGFGSAAYPPVAPRVACILSWRQSVTIS